MLRSPTLWIALGLAVAAALAWQARPVLRAWRFYQAADAAPDPDWPQLQALVARGVDLGAPHVVRYQLTLSDQAAAAAAAAAVHKAGGWDATYVARVGERWAVFAEARFVPTPEAVKDRRLPLAFAARELGAEYEGWSLDDTPLGAYPPAGTPAAEGRPAPIPSAPGT